MIRFAFMAHNGERYLPLEVAVEFQPGNQTQAARRKAVGELLFALETDEATVDAGGPDMLRVRTPAGTWIIAEATAAGGGRGKV